jgi:hypothetical protein
VLGSGPCRAFLVTAMELFPCKTIENSDKSAIAGEAREVT